MALTREDREYCASKGICTHCGKRHATVGFMSCEVCRKSALKRHRAKAKKNEQRGLCVVCGKNAPAPGRKMCRPCLDRNNNHESV